MNTLPPLPAPALLSVEEKRQIAGIVYTECQLLPSANFYTAAEFAIDAALAAIAAQAQPKPLPCLTRK